LVAFAFASTSAQEIDCTDEFFRVSRRADSCRDFFICMIGSRVDFSCDEGDIFDESRIMCRRGDAETCEFIAPTIPDDECENDFLRVGVHPDPDQCWRFFVCMNYNIVQFQCERGYIFSESTQRCVVGSHETCVEGELTPYQRMLASFGQRV
jgi:Chitin binding Peritrophin-A domain